MLKLKGKRPTNLGVKQGKLAPCPDKPNCVCSQADASDSHYIDPFRFGGDGKAAMARLSELVRAQPRTQIIEQTDRYICAEFSSRLMGFVDDVEFYLAPDAGLIHMRSASRLGYSDLGVNRARITALRAAFDAR